MFEPGADAPTREVGTTGTGPAPRPTRTTITLLATWVSLGAASMATGCAKAPPPLPESGTMRYYRIPWPDAFPSDAVVGEDGRLWFTDRLTHAIAVFDPDRESFRRIPTPTTRSAPYGLVSGPDGGLWFGESNGGRLGRIDPVTETITEVPVGLANGPQLLAWADGALWFTSLRDDAVGRYRPRSGRGSEPGPGREAGPGDPDVRVWRVASPRLRRGPEDPYGIAATPDGRVWMGRQDGSVLYRVDALPDSLDVLDFTTLPTLVDTVDFTEPAPMRITQRLLDRLPPEMIERLRNRRRGVGMRRVAAGPDGRLWVAGHGGGRVVGIHPDTDEKRILATLEPRSQPYAVAVDPWGRVWYSEQGTDAIVVYDPAADERRRLPLPLTGGTVRDMAIDAERGRVWLPMSDIGAIAVVQLSLGSEEASGSEHVGGGEEASGGEEAAGAGGDDGGRPHDGGGCDDGASQETVPARASPESAEPWGPARRAPRSCETVPDRRRYRSRLNDRWRRDHRVSYCFVST